MASAMGPLPIKQAWQQHMLQLRRQVPLGLPRMRWVGLFQEEGITDKFGDCKME